MVELERELLTHLLRLSIPNGRVLDLLRDLPLLDLLRDLPLLDLPLRDLPVLDPRLLNLPVLDPRLLNLPLDPLPEPLVSLLLDVLLWVMFQDLQPLITGVFSFQQMPDPPYTILIYIFRMGLCVPMNA